MKAVWDRVLLFVFSIIFIVGLVYLTYKNPNPSDRQWFTYLWMLALGGAGFAAFLPGSIEWQVKPGLKATGALVIVLLVVYFGREVRSALGLKDWNLVPSSDGIAPNPREATIYVKLNGQVVKVDGEPARWVTTKDNSKFSQGIRIDRDSPGAISIHLDGAEEGDTIQFFVQHGDRWWSSSEKTIPPAQNLTLMTVTEQQAKNALQRKDAVQ
jgi:hypothetical protein